MGYLKHLELEGPKPLRIEKTYRLTKPVGSRQFREAFEAFAVSVIPAPFRAEPRVNASMREGVDRSFAVTDADGKFACESLDQLQEHLGSRRVENFGLKLTSHSLRQTLIVRSGGHRVTVASSAWTREAALRVFEPIVATLGLVSPGGDAPRPGRVNVARFDAFIVHASEDKAAVARPIRDRLKARGYDAWLDVLKLKVGDSLRDEIDKGLGRSRHGIVILSPAFFKKSWPRHELDALFSLEMVVQKRMILPVLHRMTHAQLSRRSPLLAARLAASMSDGLDRVVGELVAAMGAPLRRRAAPSRVAALHRAFAGAKRRRV